MWPLLAECKIASEYKPSGLAKNARESNQQRGFAVAPGPVREDESACGCCRRSMKKASNGTLLKWSRVYNLH